MNKTKPSWADYFTPEKIKNDIEEVKRLRIFVSICAMAVAFMTISTVLRLSADLQYGASNYIGPLLIVVFSLLPFIVKYTQNLTYPVYVGFVFSFIAIIHRSFYDEFLYSTAIVWLVSIPALAMTILERKKSIHIMILSFITLTVIGFLHFKQIGFAAKDPQLFATYLFVMFFIALTSSLFHKEKEIVQAKYLELQMHTMKKERLSMLGEMVAGLAHEINNPLTIIVASSNLIEKEILMHASPESSHEKVKKLNQKVAFHSARINRLITSLREYSKNEDEIKKDFFSINDLIENLIEDRDNQISKMGIDFRVKNSQEELVAFGNSIMIRHALLNLIENSIEAVSKLKERWIEVELKCDHEKVEILVTDSGHGIPEEYSDKIMNAFFTTKDIGKGIGIGLLLSSRYLELNKGAVHFNKLSPNTQFIVTLPFIANLPNFAEENEERFVFKKKAA